MALAAGDTHRPIAHARGAMEAAFDAYFRAADLDRDGRISGQEAVAFFKGSGLPQPVLAQVVLRSPLSPPQRRAAPTTAICAVQPPPVRFESQGAWSVRPSCSVGISSSLGLREPRFWIPRCSFWFMDGCRCIPLLPKESTLSYFSVLMLKCVLLLLP